MKLLLAIISLLLLLFLEGFCTFGLLATFEPTNNPGQFSGLRIFYSVVGIGCVVGVILLISNAAHRK
jgi:hypothetical protein